MTLKMRQFLNALALQQPRQYSSPEPKICALCAQPIRRGDSYRRSGARAAHGICFSAVVADDRKETHPQ